MKHLYKLLLCTLLALTVACGGSSSEAEPAGAPAGDTPAEAAVEDTGAVVVESAYGRGEGVIGNVMKAANLEFTLNSAYLTPSYQTVTADAGMTLLVLNITTHVLQSSELKLYDTDYQVQWGGTGEEDYSVPVTYRDEWATMPTYKRYVNLDGVEGMFMGETVLQPDETLTTDYVYQVPEGFSDFTLQFQEFFEDESLGDRFVVSFTAAPQE